MLNHSFNIVILAVILLGPTPLSFQIQKSFFPQQKKPFHTLFIFLVAWCTITISMVMLLGVLASFSLRRILFTEILLFGIGTLLLFWHKTHIPEELRQIFRQNHNFSRFEIIIVFLLVLQSLALLWFIVSTPIKDYDSLFYHMTNMADWYQTGRIDRLPSYGQIGYYTYTWELFSALFMFPFQSDFLVGFPNWLAWNLLGLAIVISAIELGANRSAALLAVGISLAMPHLVQQTTTLSVDLGFAAFFMAAMASILLFHRTRSTGYLALFVAVCGILLGIKMSAVPYLGILILLLLILEIRGWIGLKRRVPDVRFLQMLFPWRGGKQIGFMGASLVLALFIGGYWYWMNWIESGNPLGYIEVRVANQVIFPGITDLNEALADSYPNASDYPAHLSPINGIYAGLRTFNEYVEKTPLANLFNVRDRAHWDTLLQAFSGATGYPGIFLGSLAGLLLVSVIRFRSHPIGLFNVGICITLLILTWAIYWVTPYSGDNGSHDWQITPWIGYQTRFAFPFLALLAVGAACGASLLRYSRTLLTIFLAISMVMFYQQTEKLFEVIVLVIVVWLAGNMLSTQVFYRLWDKQKSLLLAGASISLVGVIFAASFFAFQKRFERQDIVHGQVYTFIEQNTRPGDRIAYVVSTRPYLLFGRRLDRRAVQILADKDMEKGAWMAKLQQEKIKLVAMGPLWGGAALTSAREYRWLLDSQDFKVVWGGDIQSGLTIFRRLNIH